MDDPIKTPKYWRDRANATRAKAHQLRYDPREMRRMLRVAEEYEKLADRCAEWQGKDGKAQEPDDARGSTDGIVIGGFGISRNQKSFPMN
jgi:hypothetical protein